MAKLIPKEFTFCHRRENAPEWRLALKKRKRDNRGFTLLELMIAVIILAVIIVPLLHSFVTSYTVNSRSRRMMRATTLAQDVMEIFEREKLEDMKTLAAASDADAKYGDFTFTDLSTPRDPAATPTDPTDPTSPPADPEDAGNGLYEFAWEGVVNEGSDGSGIRIFHGGSDVATYDVTVTLDAQRNSSYFDENTAQVADINTLSALDSGAYVQRVRNLTQTSGMDEEAYNYFYTHQKTGGTEAREDFARHLHREITLTVEQKEQAGRTVTIAKAEYVYILDDTYAAGIVEAADRRYSSGEKIFFNNAQTDDGDGNPVALQSVYLFYAPRYVSGKAVPDSDVIIIRNEDKLPVNIYLMEQNVINFSDDYDDETPSVNSGPTFDRTLYDSLMDTAAKRDYVATCLYDVNHKAGGRDEIRIYDGVSAGESGASVAAANYFINLDYPDPADPTIDPADPTSPPTDPNALPNCQCYDIDAGAGASALASGKINDTNVVSFLKLKSLNEKTAYDRIYTMTVRVYEHGSDPAAEPLVTLTGSKIE